MSSARIGFPSAAADPSAWQGLKGPFFSGKKWVRKLLWLSCPWQLCYCWMPFLWVAVANQAALPEPQHSRRNDSGAEQEQERWHFWYWARRGSAGGQALLTLLTCSLVLPSKPWTLQWEEELVLVSAQPRCRAAVLVLCWVVLGSAWVRASLLSGIVWSVEGKSLCFSQSSLSGPVLQRQS